MPNNQEYLKEESKEKSRTERRQKKKAVKMRVSGRGMKRFANPKKKNQKS